MVYLVVTRAAYDELRSTLGKAPSPIWVGDGVLTDVELDQLRSAGVVVTNFNYSAQPSESYHIEGMLNTVALHHPGQTIWVERSSDV